MRIAIVMLAAVASPDPSYPSDGHGLSEVGGTAFADSRRLFAGEQQWNDTLWFHGKRRGVGRHGRESHAVQSLLQVVQNLLQGDDVLG